MLRGALVGLGNVAVHGHLPGWLARPDVRIVAAADTDPARRALAAGLPGARWYGSARDLLAAEALDFVDICTPPSAHAELIRAALERDLHVLCEKPLVSSPAALAELAALAPARDRVLHTVHNWQRAPVVERTAHLLSAGAIGPVRRVAWETRRLRPAVVAGEVNGNWRVDPEVAGGGVLADHGWHVFYVLRRWLGQDPVSVSGVLERRRHRQWAVEDTARVRIGFPAAIAEVLLTWAADERSTRVEIEGRDGVLRIDDALLVVTRPGAVDERRVCSPGLSAGSHHPEWFHGVVDEFVAAATGRAPRAGNLAEASLCVRLEALARESSRRGGSALHLAGAPAAVGPAGPGASG